MAQNLLDQLKVTYAKISIFDILHLSLVHREALFEVLKKIKVNVDIVVVKFIELVTIMETYLTYNMFSFQDSAFPSEDVIEKNLE